MQSILGLYFPKASLFSCKSNPFDVPIPVAHYVPSEKSRYHNQPVGVCHQKTNLASAEGWWHTIKACRIVFKGVLDPHPLKYEAPILAASVMHEGLQTWKEVKMLFCMNPRAGLETMGFNYQSCSKNPPAYSFTEEGIAEKQFPLHAVSGVFTPIDASDDHQMCSLEGLRNHGVQCKRHQQLDICTGVAGSKGGGILTFWGRITASLIQEIHELLSSCQPKTPIPKPVRQP